MKTVLTTVASAALLALVALPASAQAPADPAGAAPQAEGQNPFTVANIDPAAPFGLIDVTPAGPSVETVRAWADTLNDDLQLELTQRCEVIGANEATFPESARTFCEAWETAMAGEAGAMGAQGVIPGPAMAPAEPGAAAPAPAAPGDPAGGGAPAPAAP